MRNLSRNVIGVLLGVSLLFAPSMSAALAETPDSTYESVARPTPTSSPTLESTVVDPYGRHGIMPEDHTLSQMPEVGAAIVFLFIGLGLSSLWCSPSAACARSDDVGTGRHLPVGIHDGSTRWPTRQG
jgi:hypothetical protein